MKKILFAAVALFLVVGTASAQTGKKALKMASKSIGKYTSNLEKVEDLQKGLSLLETAMKAEEINNNAKSLVTIAGLYNKISDAEMKQKLVNPEYSLANPTAALKGYEAIQAAANLGDAKAMKKLYKALPNLENSLNNTGIVFFDQKQYGEAFKYYAASVNAIDMLKAAGKKTRLDDAEQYKQHLFITGASAYYGNDRSQAKPYFEKLMEMGSDKPLVYEGLYVIGNEAGEENAVQYLTKGRELFPDDSGLLFAEINAYLKAGKLEELISKLESAKEKEPENLSIILTLGNVYDQLSQKETEAGNTAKSDEYFDKAMQYYDEVLAKDPKDFTAVYSQGALWYNKAANLTGELNKLADDYSPAGTKKYDALKATMNGYFDKALPFFQKAETLNGQDSNVLIALKEIYAKKNMLDKATEYKAKLDALK